MRLNIRLFSAIKPRRPFYITTPIFYVNASPHIGHLYSAVLADAVQRFEKLTNPDINVIFSTGTDEHGTKIQQAASKAGLQPQQFCDNISEEYQKLFKDFNVEYTDFVRTTEERHKNAVQHFWNKLKKDDYIYKAKYSGWYSVNDETFVPESQVRDELRDGQKVKVSAESGHRLEWTEETNYMFRLSAFKTHLQNWLRNDGVIAPLKFQKQLQETLDNDKYFADISVSRPTSRVNWAIRVPDDEEQSIYVWMDALVNYLTVAGYPNEEVMRSRGRLWPADLHVVGKDILKFHGIYWPAFLMALKWHPPRRLLVHGHWTVDGVKMSKSLQNVVDPRSCTNVYEATRYMLLREHTLHSDANFSKTKLINTINAELADTLGNLASRCSGQAINPRREWPCPPNRYIVENELTKAVENLPETCKNYYSTYLIYKAVDAVIHVLHLANLHFETHKPWELAKKPECQTQLDEVLHVTMETLRICAIILQPIIPEMSGKLLDHLAIPKEERTWQHCERISWKVTDVFPETKKIQSHKVVLFQRIYTDRKVQKKAKAG